MDCFSLAYLQLKREGLLGVENEVELMIKRAITISKTISNI